MQINVVLQRGLLGQIYSLGMDGLGAKIAKLPGVDFVTVEDYASWRSIRDRLTRWKDPTVLIGHSYGSNASTIIPESLGAQVQFPLIITVDPSPYWSWYLWQAGPSRIGANVARAVNLYQTSGLIGRQQLYPASGASPVIINQAIQSSHTQIDDDEQVQDRVMEEVKRVIAS